ncbi:uncharacterized protein N7459_000369 [Penicillium hispanicum]|uniref:uncharacterized protein n=1 Tax=Penicillium hispanicum TaxID=1080232 RepID=UPI002541B903|nr:uncharacterized protein N7459_000369 [Penicillium hispanicum]KAJ5594161.1 hypothetical protein N7459_000369 [Penicillium hispanicum]
MDISTSTENTISSSDRDGQDTFETGEIKNLRQTAHDIAKIQNLGFLDDPLLKSPQFLVCGRPAIINAFLSEITHIPFPREEDDFPRHATEVVLKHDSKYVFRLAIKPGHSRTNGDECQVLNAFKHEFTIQSPQLCQSIKDARDLLKSMRHGRISDDILKIEVHAPHQPSLKIIDLPGCRDLRPGESFEAQEKVIRERFISKPTRHLNIILAIASTKESPDLQSVLKIAREFDPIGARTLGILTDMESVPEGSALEKTYTQIIKNEEVQLEEGWHALGGFEVTQEAPQQGDPGIRVFNRPLWTSVDKKLLGIYQLGSRLHTMKWRLSAKFALSKLHACSERLSIEIIERIRDQYRGLGRLGPPRPTLQQQREFLLKVSSSFSRILDQAATGLYTDAFFDSPDHTSDADKYDHRKLRACIYQLNTFFAQAMAFRGCSRHVKGVTYKGFLMIPQENPYVGRWVATEVDRSVFEREVQAQVAQNRGCPDPGAFHQLVVNRIFRDQSKPWEELARHHLLTVWKTIRFFVSELLRTLTDDDTHIRLMDHIFEDQLETARNRVLEKLEELTACYKRPHPLPIANNYLARIPSSRGVCWTSPYFDSDAYAAAMTEMVTFGNNIATLAIENCLVAPLADMFDTQKVHNLSDQQVQELVMETPSQHQQRANAHVEIEKLQSAQAVLNKLSKPSLDLPPAITALSLDNSVSFKPRDSNGERRNREFRFRRIPDAPGTEGPRSPSTATRHRTPFLSRAPSTAGFVWPTTPEPRQDGKRVFWQTITCFPEFSQYSQEELRLAHIECGER